MTTLTIDLADAVGRQIDRGPRGKLATGLRTLFRALGIEDHRIDLREALADQREIAVVWGVDDVQEVRPDLTDEQAWEVLTAARRYHDAEIGISWDVLACHADMMFPEPTEERP